MRPHVGEELQHSKRPWTVLLLKNLRYVEFYVTMLRLSCVIYVLLRCDSCSYFPPRCCFLNRIHTHTIHLLIRVHTVCICIQLYPLSLFLCSWFCISTVPILSILLDAERRLSVCKSQRAVKVEHRLAPSLCKCK